MVSLGHNELKKIYEYIYNFPETDSVPQGLMVCPMIIAPAYKTGRLYSIGFLKAWGQSHSKYSPLNEN